jgi:hypothetical protein
MLDAMPEAVGLAVASFVATALRAAALLALVSLRVRLAFIPTLAWSYVASIHAIFVLAQPMPATDRAQRCVMIITAVAQDAAVRGTTHRSLACVMLSHALFRNLRTFGSELHGQWHAEEGIETFSAGVGIGLRFDVDLRFSFCAGSCTRQVIKRRRASPGQW